MHFPRVLFCYFVFFCNPLCSFAIIPHVYLKDLTPDAGKWGKDSVSGLCWESSTFSYLIGVPCAPPPYWDWSQTRSQECLVPLILWSQTPSSLPSHETTSRRTLRLIARCARPVFLNPIRRFQLGPHVLARFKPGYVSTPRLLKKRVFYFDREMTKNVKADKNLLLLFQIC